MTEPVIYQSLAEIEGVVRRFENCEYKPEEFFHARHLTVAAWYFLHQEKEAAKAKMREGLRKFISFHGKQGYHVTITEFWLGRIEAALARATGGDLLASIHQVVAPLCDKGLIYEHYSRQRIESPEAKTRWLEPDIRPLASDAWTETGAANS